jgi:uncharacterized protein YbjT (DUF2867 family)
MVLTPVSESPPEPLGRLVRQAGAGRSDSSSRIIGVVGPGETQAQVRGWLGRNPDAGGLVVLGWGGTHRDARAAALRAQWDLEEACRALPTRVLVLRVAPLVGAASPFWLRLRSAGASGNRPFQPVAEADVVETLRRAAVDDGGWGEWFDVAGRDAWTLTELSAMAAPRGPGAGPGSWEPEPEILAEQKLVDPAPWMARFGISPVPLAEEIGRWAA